MVTGAKAFLDEIEERNPGCVASARKLIRWFREVEGATTEATPKGWYAFHFERRKKDRHPYHLCYLTKRGEIKVHIKRLYWRGKPKPDGQRFPPFDDESVRSQLGTRLQQITRAPPPGKSDGICSFMVDRLDDERDFERFAATMEWMIERIRAS